MSAIKNILFIGLLLFLLTGCTVKQQKGKKPKPFLDEKEMVDVLVDFRITESAIREMAAYGQDTKKMSAYYYRKMFEKHHITLEEFKANLNYYSQDPKQIHDIYSQVITRITEMQADLVKRRN